MLSLSGLRLCIRCIEPTNHIKPSTIERPAWTRNTYNRDVDSIKSGIDMGPRTQLGDPSAGKIEVVERGGTRPVQLSEED